MPSFTFGAWLFLTVALASVVGVLAWMVSAGYVSGDVLYAALTAILTGITGIVFHSAGATAALATPPAPTTSSTTETKSV